jgi:preprotein translocase subunit SecY
MNIIDKITQIWKLKDLRNKILYTLLVLVIFRILAHVPMPGVNLEELRQFFSKNQIFGLLNLFSGGAMSNFSLIMMGVGPYITSSIIFQLLQMIVPQLEALSKEGEYGRKKINSYTRIATVPLAIMQSYAMVILLKNQGVVGDLPVMTLVTTLIALTGGTILLMWLGELISENGVGNGISLIITLGILGGLPSGLRNTLAILNPAAVENPMAILDPSQWDGGGLIKIIIFLILAILVIAAIVFVNEGQRQIPVTYARRVRGMRSYGGVDTFLPLKVLMAGVIPIIFAMSMMIFPGVIGKFFELAKSTWLSSSAKFVVNLFQNNTFYSIAYFVLVVLFTYFYTSVIFHPEQVAENLQKQGGFIPGVRPGKETAHYLKTILNRITFIGAVFLGLIAILPFIVQNITNINTIALGGTGLLIVVSVILETTRQIKAQLVMRTYDQY